tara:strand:+ start:9325 stop:9525 length:201 start_codon:yes stop_codon:yes gene_type:complete
MIKEGSIHLGNKVRAHNGTKLHYLAGAIIKVGDNSVIGAGSLLTKNIPANIIAAWNPCRALKPINK